MSNSNTSFKSNLVRLFRLSHVRELLQKLHRRYVFSKAIRKFRQNPWCSLDYENEILEDLVYGWGNASWSAEPKFLAATIREFSRSEGTVLECGSGLTTIVLGILADRSNRAIWTLENLDKWGRRVTDELDRLAIRSVRVHIAPLKNYGEYSWYVPPIDDVPSDIDLVVCDGPPGGGHGGRIGMLPVMRSFLTKDCTILLDDVGRESEFYIATRWAETLGSTVENGQPRELFATIRAHSGADGYQLQQHQDRPEVTVGVPAYNSAEFIEQSATSILNQKDANITLIISDNNSSDDTGHKCLQLAKNDSRVQYYRQEKNVGVFQNYNEVFLKARTKYFKWQSSSDWSAADFVNSCVEVLENNPDVVLVYPRAYLVNEDASVEAYDGDFGLEMDDATERFIYLLENIRLSNFFNATIRSAALRKTKLNRVFPGSDVVLLAELALQGKFVLLDEPMWWRRMTPSTASKLQSAEQRADFFSGEPEGFGKYETWKKFAALTIIVFGSSIEIRTKVACLRFLAKKWVWARVDLWRELVNRN